VNLLRELRYVAAEVGYREAQRMPVEVRRWWIEEMRKDAQRGAGTEAGDETAMTGRSRTVTR
jgi:hypothetical protein